MKLGLIINSRFKKYENHYYSINFDENLWNNRYLKFFDEIVVVGYEEEVIENPEGKYVQSDIDKVKFKCIPVKKKVDRLIKYNDNMAFVENAISDCDAVILRSWWGVSVCRKLKKIYMIEVVNCMWDSLWNHSMLGKMVAVPYTILQKKAIKKAPYVLYVTNQFLQQRYPTQGKSCGISDVVINDEIQEDILSKRLKKIEKGNSCKIIIGTAAAVNVAYKGQKYVIDALSILKRNNIDNYEYHMAGSGNQEQLRKYAKKKNVTEIVKFCGAIPKEKMTAWYDSIDIYIQPSFQEGLPRAVVEAMSRALPCLGSDAGGIPELLQPSSIFKRRHKFAKQIANKLQRMTVQEMKELSRYSIEKAKEFAPDILDVERNHFYEKFVQESKQHAARQTKKNKDSLDKR